MIENILKALALKHRDAKTMEERLETDEQAIEYILLQSDYCSITIKYYDFYFNEKYKVRNYNGKPKTGDVQ